jgi:putative iron-dependent peroxidase
MGVPQAAIESGPGRHALFLALAVGASEDDARAVRQLGADLAGLVRTVGHRDESAALSCVFAIGADAWERLAPGRTRPAQLHPFRPLEDGARRAPSTPGDLLLHIRAERADFCFELGRLIIDRLGSAVQVVDETHGFSYMDSRDLIGFVDGTENPAGEARREATIVGEEDAAHAGGSYVTVQRYVTDFDRWAQTPIVEQEQVIGRTKVEGIELDGPPSAHKERAKLVRDGVELKILRQNRPWGTTRESGTYFIAYARDLSVTEGMLERMFIADADGLYDHLLDFTHAVTGVNFFAPAVEVLESLDVTAEATAAEASPDDTLGIGSLRERERS